MKRNERIAQQLEKYVPFNNTELKMKERFLEFVLENENCMSPQLLIGHVTGSAWIIDKTRTYALLAHHKKLDKWLQLGGHCEDEDFVVYVSKREAFEESGLTSLSIVNDEIFSLDVHPIPEKNGIPKHFHYDLRFLFIADINEQIVVSSESKDVKWLKLDEISNYNTDDALQRMISKTLNM